MPLFRSALSAIAFTLLAVTSASDTVQVVFVAPQTYRDDDLRGTPQRDGIIRELRVHLDKLGQRYLKDGQNLSIEVLDIDFAGRYEPWRHAFHDVRILSDVTPPRIKMRYELRQGGKVLIRGEETVTDLNYLSNPRARYSSGRLAHEKEMLRDWFRKRFVRLKPAAR